MSQTPFTIKNLGPGKSAGGSEVRVKLGGYYLLKEEELFLLKSFMSGMKNYPTKTMVSIKYFPLFKNNIN